MANGGAPRLERDSEVKGVQLAATVRQLLPLTYYALGIPFAGPSTANPCDCKGWPYLHL